MLMRFPIRSEFIFLQAAAAAAEVLAAGRDVASFSP
jgi:hypothetical protein